MKAMSVKERRLDHGWSQEQLAEVSGLSNRTIQRIEQGKNPSLESLKCLAAVFETNVTTLMQEHSMTPTKTVEAERSNHSKSEGYSLQQQELEAIEYVKNLKGFHLGWMTALVVIPALYALNLYVSPQYLWVLWVAGFWGLAIVLHALVLFSQFGILGAEWEQRKFRERMNHLRH